MAGVNAFSVDVNRLAGVGVIARKLAQAIRNSFPVAGEHWWTKDAYLSNPKSVVEEFHTYVRQLEGYVNPAQRLFSDQARAQLFTNVNLSNAQPVFVDLSRGFRNVVAAFDQVKQHFYLENAYITDGPQVLFWPGVDGVGEGIEDVLEIRVNVPSAGKKPRSVLWQTDAQDIVPIEPFPQEILEQLEKSGQELLDALTEHDAMLPAGAAATGGNTGEGSGKNAPLLERLCAILTPNQGRIFEHLWEKGTASFDTLSTLPGAFQPHPTDDAIIKQLKALKNRMEQANLPIGYLTISTAKKRVTLENPAKK
jgi:hypothetical protein